MLAERAGRALKRTVLELGGFNPMIILTRGHGLRRPHRELLDHLIINVRSDLDTTPPDKRCYQTSRCGRRNPCPRSSRMIIGLNPPVQDGRLERCRPARSASIPRRLKPPIRLMTRTWGARKTRLASHGGSGRVGQNVKSLLQETQLFRDLGDHGCRRYRREL